LKLLYQVRIRLEMVLVGIIIARTPDVFLDPLGCYFVKCSWVHGMSGFSVNPDAAIKSHPLCEEIVHFLNEHDGAMDTLQGVAAFWVGSEEVAAKSALECLASAGIVVTRTLSSGTYYSLTTDPTIRNWVMTGQSRLPQQHRPSGGSSEVIENGAGESV
jgi:hypothetical protein